MGIKYLVDSRARKLAFVVVGALFIGNLLAETGDMARLTFNLAPLYERIILDLWLAVGIFYCTGTYFALGRR